VISVILVISATSAIPAEIDWILASSGRFWDCDKIFGVDEAMLDSLGNQEDGNCKND
jgi:hypothetical protein